MKLNLTVIVTDIEIKFNRYPKKRYLHYFTSQFILNLWCVIYGPPCILFLSFVSNVPSLCYILTVILKVLVLNAKFDFGYILTLILKGPVPNFRFKILSLESQFCSFNCEFDRMRIHVLNCTTCLRIILNLPELFLCVVFVLVVIRFEIWLSFILVHCI